MQKILRLTLLCMALDMAALRSSRMNTRALLIPGLLAALYVAWPYATLVKLRQDLRNHDVSALNGDIDWNSVRGGLKQEILDSLQGRPLATDVAAESSDDDLPPFGASFAASLASRAVDRQVTPQRLVAAFSAMSPGTSPALQPRLQTARFDSVTDFVVKLHTVQQEPTDAPVCLHLSLVHHGWHLGWRVTRVWIPPELLQQSETHAS
jgi:hypothetical protein